jgi:hypothetical protein
VTPRKRAYYERLRDVLEKKGDVLRYIRWGTRIAEPARGPLLIQADLLLFEQTNEVVFYFEKPLWVLFYLCQCTEMLEFVASFMVHRLTPAPIGIVSVPNILPVEADPVNFNSSTPAFRGSALFSQLQEE